MQINVTILFWTILLVHFSWSLDTAWAADGIFKLFKMKLQNQIQGLFKQAI